MKGRADASGPHGILVVDKPQGPTSHDIVQGARRLLRTRRVGHAGTLDPMATGVLVLLLGEATKLSEIATAADKTYRAQIRFGRATDSHDADGRTTAEAAVDLREIGAVALNQALASERLRTLQVPPAVSAIKLQGRRAYELSRSGAPPELAPRSVSVREIVIVEHDAQTLSLELRVSKGYYVRALARDLGLSLGVPAHLSQLRRLVSGSFSLAEACAWPPAHPPEPLALRDVLARLTPMLRLTDDGVRRARAGQRLSAEDFLDPPPGGILSPSPSESSPCESPGAGSEQEGTGTTLCTWTDQNGSPIALGELDGGFFRVRRGFSAELPTMNESL
ncbi:MAG: tRNA pseudouridine(55) synthase TruB [Deltaproteobacteria bacterium]